MVTQLAERKAIYKKIRGLSNADAARVMDFIDGMGDNSFTPDPFYSESNMKHLLAVKADAQTGLNMSVHELVEA